MDYQYGSAKTAWGSNITILRDFIACEIVLANSVLRTLLAISTISNPTRARGIIVKLIVHNISRIS